eukprot:328938-Amphidinium_carterae.2
MQDSARMPSSVNPHRKAFVRGHILTIGMPSANDLRSNVSQPGISALDFPGMCAACHNLGTTCVGPSGTTMCCESSNACLRHLDLTNGHKSLGASTRKLCQGDRHCLCTIVCNFSYKPPPVIDPMVIHMTTT